MGLIENLERWKIEGRIVGFCPYRDAELTAWGFITNYSKRTITLNEVSPLGQREGETTYFLSKISYFDEGPLYSERLNRLLQFVPTKPETLAFIRSRSELRAMLEEAKHSTEICNVKVRDDVGLKVRVLSVDYPWVGFAEYNDLMIIPAIRYGASRPLRAFVAERLQKKLIHSWKASICHRQTALHCIAHSLCEWGQRLRDQA